MSEERLKRCTRCGEDKPLSAFPLNFDKRTGRYYPRGHCKACKMAVAAAARAADPEAFRRAERLRWRRRPEHYRAHSRAKHERYRQQDRARKKRPENLLRARLLQAARRSGDALTVLFGAVCLADPCGYCSGFAEHLDHIQPVSRGGQSGWENLAGACAHCNHSKSDRPLLLFLLERVA